MGCGPSHHRTLETVDDSVHVMLKHDKKVAAKKGQPINTGYVPRAEHPLLHVQEERGTKGEEEKKAKDEVSGAEVAAAATATQADEAPNGSNVDSSKKNTTTTTSSTQDTTT
jgi:hypothetical protein